MLELNITQFMAQMFSKWFSFILSMIQIWANIKDPQMTDMSQICWPPPAQKDSLCYFQLEKKLPE